MAEATFNIRYNDKHSSSSLKKNLIKYLVKLVKKINLNLK